MVSKRLICMESLSHRVAYLSSAISSIGLAICSGSLQGHLSFMSFGCSLLTGSIHCGLQKELWTCLHLNGTHSDSAHLKLISSTALDRKKYRQLQMNMANNARWRITACTHSNASVHEHAGMHLLAMCPCQRRSFTCIQGHCCRPQAASRWASFQPIGGYGFRILLLSTCRRRMSTFCTTTMLSFADAIPDQHVCKLGMHTCCCKN